jgi:hypothetical protein
LKIYSLKRMTLPKVAVLAAGLAAAVLVTTINPLAAQATPRAANCAGCHSSATGAVSTVTAVPSTATPAAGATYTVAITMSANPLGGNTGFGVVAVAPAPAPAPIVRGGPSAALSYTATMVAPAAAGTYSYTVYTNQGLDDASVATPVALTGSKVFTITVAPVATTPPPTTTTTTPPPTTTTTTPPPTTTTTTPPPTTTTTTPPPTTTTTTPPPTTTTTPPPVSLAKIRGLSPNHGKIGTKVTIVGRGFGTAGVVNFGKVAAKASSWTGTRIVFTVPSGHFGQFVLVTVTPDGSTASNGAKFSVGSRHGDNGHHGDDGHHGHSRHFNRLGGEFEC